MDGVTCPGCGNSLEAGVKFCPFCGTAFEAVSAPDLDAAISAAESSTDILASDYVPPPSAIDRPSHQHEHAISNKSRFHWWYLLIPAVIVGVIILLLTSSRTNIVTEFKDANAARGWQFTAYSPQSFVRSANGLAIYDGVYVYKDNYPDVTVTINAAIRTDTVLEQNGYLCMWLRYNPSLRKGYCFIVKPVAKTAHLGIASDPSPQSVDLNSLIPNFNPYQAHTYMASAKGEYLQFAIDGRQIANLYDVGLLKGQVALEARGLGATITRAEITPGR